MPYYVKVTKKVREAILPAYLVVQKTFDRNYLLFQSALEKVEGNTLSERCKRIGGALLTPLEAKAEIKGTSCLPCHTPKEYGGEDTEENTAPGIDTGIGAGSESTDTGTEEPDTAKDAEIVTNKESEVTDE
jgi:hypothetical protein|nr:MAG TPA: cytochrome c-552 [Caudoviricetes sp.]